MTIDYRKRAEEFVEHYSCEDSWYSCPEAGGCNDSITECDCGYESKLEKLSAAFQQVAQEARQKAIDECFKIIKSYLVEQKTIYENVVSYAFSNPEDILKDIKNRMIGPEPMEEK